MAITLGQVLLNACNGGIVFVLKMALLFLAADISVEMLELPNFHHRCARFRFERPMWLLRDGNTRAREHL